MPITDDMLLEAIKKRALDELNRREEARNVIQNIIGSAGARGVPEGAGGVFDSLGGTPSPEGSIPPELQDYYVDIEKEDMPSGELPPDLLKVLETAYSDKPEMIKQLKKQASKPKGWKKSVHRFTKKKGEEPESPKPEREGKK